MVPNTQLQNVNLLMWQKKDTVRYHADIVSKNNTKGMHRAVTKLLCVSLDRAITVGCRGRKVT